MFLLLTLLLASLLILTKAACPSGTIASSDSQKCFLITAWLRDFTRNPCGSNRRAISVHNKADHESILEAAAGESYWLGATHNKTWQWLDGTPFNWTYWAAGQPPRHSKNACLLVDGVTGLWKAENCLTKAWYACQSKADFPVQPTPKPEPGCPPKAMCRDGYAYAIAEAEFPGFQVAEDYCIRRYSGHLVSIHDNATNLAVRNMFGDSGFVYNYLGGIVKNGTWTWSDGSPWDFENFGLPSLAKPLNGGCTAVMTLHYGPVHNMEWMQLICDRPDFADSFGGICKYKL
ncbi:hypothetical protein L596_016897 [Steinernema carpocapsae]|uniref:C-type lectin domain-containing protein n=1 Tax=Steinernema carpocapsae TaxID=34508 RepID=A0A4U5NKG9_STECR|nr:hypothetical protein L596_016897 [Steinernema carpocapsae]